MRQPKFILSALLVAGLAACTGAESAEQAQAPVESEPAGTKFVRYDQNGEVSWGVLEGETIHQISDAPYFDHSRTGESVALSAVELKGPAEPRQAFMTALNFRSHIGESPALPEPNWFYVLPTSISGPEADMILPEDGSNFHYEAEFVVVIGKEANNISPEEVPEYVFGVTAGNDGTDRDWQFNDIQWSRGKGTKTFNPLGPVLVKGLDYSDLEITGRLNGEEVQHARSSEMMYDFNQLISFISKYNTLLPGDVVWSGTMGTTQQMQHGDVYEVEVEGVGVLRNRLVDAEVQGTT